VQREGDLAGDTETRSTLRACAAWSW
jgi:hypothetical protein